MIRRLAIGDAVARLRKEDHMLNIFQKIPA
jgi:hypothetical protein